MIFHWQNLNEGPDGEPRGLPHCGRAWLHLSDLWTLSVEWDLWSWRLGASAGTKDDGELVASVQVPPVSLFFGLEGPMRLPHRDVSLKVYDGTIYWRLWADPDSWESSRPRWRDGGASPADLLLGKQVYTERVLGREGEVRIPMPERAYLGRAVRYEWQRKRPRWFAERSTNVRITMDFGQEVPFPGKGENSWDCGEDASFGFSCPASNVADAVGKFVGSVLESRARHGGADWRPKERGKEATWRSTQKP